MQAGQGRKPAELGALSASLDGTAAVRQRLSRDHGSDLLSIGVIQARGAPDAMENLGAACFLDRGSTSTPRVVPWQAVQKRCADRCLRPKPTGRTSRLLSCHLSVGGRLPAVPTRCFAKLRSDMTQILRLGSSFGAGSLQAMC